MPTDDSAIDQVLSHNQGYANHFSGAELTALPKRKLLVIACMDARINIQTVLGLDYGDAHILRNAGGTVTEDVMRSAIVSTNALSAREIMVINHTGCGMMDCNNQDLHDQLTEQYGPAPADTGDFHAFTDLGSHVNDQVAKLRDHPWIPPETVIRGFTYDVQTGRLHEVDCA